MKVIIAGGRDFSSYGTLAYNCNYILKSENEPIQIVSGGASGADYWGNVYATNKGYPVKYFPADWANLGKSAGPIRNRQMADYADVLICFWDGKSKGTKNMIEEANKKGLEVHIINY